MKGRGILYNNNNSNAVWPRNTNKLETNEWAGWNAASFYANFSRFSCPTGEQSRPRISIRPDPSSRFPAEADPGRADRTDSGDRASPGRSLTHSFRAPKAIRIAQTSCNHSYDCNNVLRVIKHGTVLECTCPSLRVADLQSWASLILI